MGLEPTTSAVTGRRSKPTELPGHFIISGSAALPSDDFVIIPQILENVKRKIEICRVLFDCTVHVEKMFEYSATITNPTIGE